MPLVAIVCEGEHDDGSQDVRRCNKALAGSDIEAHSNVQNDRQEISDRICASGGETEEARESPDLEVERVLQVLADFESAQPCQLDVVIRAEDVRTYSSGITS